jgi:hypothetical protein
MQEFWTRFRTSLVARRTKIITTHALLCATLGQVLICELECAQAVELKVYWSIQQDNWIRRANLDGSEPERVVETPGGAVPDIAFDPVEKKMYWPSAAVGGIQRGNYDGSEVETVISGIEMSTHLSIDAVNRKVYWIDYGGANSIWRSNLDGSTRELLADNVPSPAALEIDPVNGYYYWAESIFGRIYRTSTADTSQTEIIFDENSLGRPTFISGLAIDPVNGYAYAADFSFHAIIRVPLDGGDALDWITDGIYFPDAIVVDRTNERVIWSNSNLPGAPTEWTNISSVDFRGLDQRVDFVPFWNPYIAGWVRHLALVELPIPEPPTLTLACFATLMLSYLNCRSRARRQVGKSMNMVNV